MILRDAGRPQAYSQWAPLIDQCGVSRPGYAAIGCEVRCQAVAINARVTRVVLPLHILIGRHLHLEEVYASAR